MKLKGIELNGTYKLKCDATRFGVYDEKGKLIYYEVSDGYWSKSEYDKKGNTISYENSKGFWAKWEYDEKGDEIYHENSNGGIIDKRVKEKEND